MADVEVRGRESRIARVADLVELPVRLRAVANTVRDVLRLSVGVGTHQTERADVPLQLTRERVPMTLAGIRDQECAGDVRIDAKLHGAAEEDRTTVDR